MESMVKEWAAFFNRCLDRRVEPTLFDAATAKLHQKSPLPGNKLAALLLKPQSSNASSFDPRVLVYVEHLLALKTRQMSCLLRSTTPRIDCPRPAMTR
jgi:mediator of RNA polymerase II transcription subunit 5